MCIEKIKRLISKDSKKSMKYSEQLRFYQNYYKLRMKRDLLALVFLVLTVVILIFTEVVHVAIYSLIFGLVYLLTYVYYLYQTIILPNYYELPENVDVSISLKRIIKLKTELKHPLVEDDVIKIRQLFLNLSLALNGGNLNKLAIKDEQDCIASFNRGLDYLQSFVVRSTATEFRRVVGELTKIADMFYERTYPQLVGFYPIVIEKIEETWGVKKTVKDDEKVLEKIWGFISTEKTKIGITNLIAILVFLALLAIFYFSLTGQMPISELSKIIHY
jgi:Ca2+/Na+ antiporter